VAQPNQIQQPYPSTIQPYLAQYGREDGTADASLRNLCQTVIKSAFPTTIVDGLNAMPELQDYARASLPRPGAMLNKAVAQALAVLEWPPKVKAQVCGSFTATSLRCSRQR